MTEIIVFFFTTKKKLNLETTNNKGDSGVVVCVFCNDKEKYNL